jgi:hypothetical protein
MQGQNTFANYTNEETQDPVLAWRKLMSNFSMDFECVLPAIVQKYDRKNNLVYLQGAINHTTINGDIIERVLIKVPCFNPCGSGVGINFPLSKGDTGWIVASDRDTSLFMQELKKSPANTSIFHKFEFGFFLPDKIKGFNINSADEGALVIQTLDGTTKVSVKGGQITITSSENVNINAVNVNLSASNTTLTTETVFNGNITVNGSITSTGDMQAGGISLINHTHTGNLGAPTSPPIG